MASHRELEDESGKFLHSDRMHLNGIGIDLWCLSLQEDIKTAVRVLRYEHLRHLSVAVKGPWSHEIWRLLKLKSKYDLFRI